MFRKTLIVAVALFGLAAMSVPAEATGFNSGFRFRRFNSFGGYNNFAFNKFAYPTRCRVLHTPIRCRVSRIRPLLMDAQLVMRQPLLPTRRTARLHIRATADSTVSDTEVVLDTATVSSLAAGSCGIALGECFP